MPASPMVDRASELLAEPVVATAFLVPVGTHRRPVMGAGAVVLLIRDVIDHLRGRQEGVPIGQPQKTLIVATATRLALFQVHHRWFVGRLYRPLLVAALDGIADLRVGGNKLNTTQTFDIVTTDGQRYSYEAYFRGTPGAQIRAVAAATGRSANGPAGPMTDERGVPGRDMAAIIGIGVIIVAAVLLVLVKM